RNLQLLKYLAVTELGQALIMLVSGLVILRAGAGYEGVVVAIVLGNVFACASAMAARNRMGSPASPHAFPMATAREIVGVAAKLLPNVLLWWVIELSDRLLLAYYLGDRAVGVYSAGARLAGTGM